MLAAPCRSIRTTDLRMRSRLGLDGAATAYRSGRTDARLVGTRIEEGELHHEADTTVEIEVERRWAARALSKLLIPFHSFLVRHVPRPTRPRRVPGRDRAPEAREGTRVVSAIHERWMNENALQHELRDLVCLAVVGDHVRWVLTDDDELADWLAEAVQEWRGWAERLAAQLVRSHIAPDGRMRALAKDTRLNWVPDGWLSGEAARTLLAARLAWVVEWAWYRRSQTDSADDAELLDSVATALEAQLRTMMKEAYAAGMLERERHHRR